MEVLILHNQERVLYNKTKTLELEVVRETLCRRYLHEASKYPRKGYRPEDAPKFTLPENAKVEVVEKFINFIDGELLRVKYNDQFFDLLPKDLRFTPQL